MSVNSGYLPLSQEQDEPAPAHITPSWWPTRKGYVACLIADNAGLLLVICAQFIFASMNLSVKLLETLDPPTPAIELITLRMVIMACCCVTYMLSNKVSDPFLGPKEVRGLLFTRAFSGFLAILGIYSSLKYLSLADVTVLTFLAPFIVALAGHLLLGEAYTKKDALACTCSLFGVVLIARPTFLFRNATEEGGDGDVTSFQRLFAVGVALGGACGVSGTYISMRAIGSRAHPMHIMTFFSIFCVIVGSTAMVTIMRGSVVFPMTWQWTSLVLIVGLLSVAGQFLLTLALRYETASRSSMGQYFELLFVTVLQLLVFGTVPSSLSATGGVIILAAQAYVLFAKQASAHRSPRAPSPIPLDVVQGTTHAVPWQENARDEP